MPRPADKLMPAPPEDFAAALVFALRYEGRKRRRDADEIMSEIVVKRLVRHLARRLRRPETSACRRRGGARTQLPKRSTAPATIA
jgi:hypothetical protein